MCLSAILEYFLEKKMHFLEMLDTSNNELLYCVSNTQYLGMFIKSLISLDIVH